MSNRNASTHHAKLPLPPILLLWKVSTWKPSLPHLLRHTSRSLTSHLPTPHIQPSPHSPLSPHFHFDLPPYVHPFLLTFIPFLHQYLMITSLHSLPPSLPSLPLPHTVVCQHLMITSLHSLPPSLPSLPLPTHSGLSAPHDHFPPFTSPISPIPSPSHTQWSVSTS